MPDPPAVEGISSDMGRHRGAMARASVRAVLLPRTWTRRTLPAAVLLLVAVDVAAFTPLPWWGSLLAAAGVLAAVFTVTALLWGRPRAGTRWYVHPTQTVVLAVRARRRCWHLANHVKIDDDAPAAELRRTVLASLAPVAREHQVDVALRAVSPKLEALYREDFASAGLWLERRPSRLDPLLGTKLVCTPRP